MANFVPDSPHLRRQRPVSADCYAGDLPRKNFLILHLMSQVLEYPFLSHWGVRIGMYFDFQWPFVKMLNKAGSIFLMLILSSKVPVTKAPFIYSKTEELVWKWEQSKLCGQSINITLSSTMIPQGHPPNKADSQGKFVSIENGVIHVSLKHSSRTWSHMTIRSEFWRQRIQQT